MTTLKEKGGSFDSKKEKTRRIKGIKGRHRGEAEG